MFKMDEKLIKKHQNLINYLNADSMFSGLEQIINNNGKEFILKEEHETEEECVKSYVARANVMKIACEAIEHYAKAILIQNGHTWDESKSWGHNMLDLFMNLDKESKSLILVTLMPYNKLDSHDLVNNYDDYDKAMMYLIKMLCKNYLIENPEEINNNYIDNTNNFDKYIYNEPYKQPYIPQDENIVGMKDDQTVEGELKKLNPEKIPGQPKQQLFGIKSRFPGQYLVEGNAEFLISLAYTMNQISHIYRQSEEKLHQI